MEEVKDIFECLYDAVIIKENENDETLTQSGIIVPDMGKEKHIHGVVIAVGPGKNTITGDTIPNQLKPGDKVLLPTMGFTTFEHNGEEYLIGNEDKVLCKYK